VIFFFSSRRRHTRSYGDWSSDVCSSDLSLAEPPRSLFSMSGKFEASYPASPFWPARAKIPCTTTDFTAEPVPELIHACVDGKARSEEHTSELQSPYDLVCRLLLEKKKKI